MNLMRIYNPLEAPDAFYLPLPHEIHQLQYHFILDRSISSHTTTYIVMEVRVKKHPGPQGDTLLAY
jgi:hypothetical protein